MLVLVILLPSFSRFLEEKYGAVIVGWAYSSIPIDCYARTVHNNDPLRTIASRHMVLFSETPDWRLKDAQLHKCDGVIEIVSPSTPSLNRPLFEESGMPLLSILADRDDAKTRSLLSNFIENRLLSKKGKGKRRSS